MECPRCKFVQPNDRFCANCGLNVEVYAAKPKPLLQRLLGHPALYVVAAVVSGLILVQVVKKTVVSVVEKTGLTATESVPVANQESLHHATAPTSGQPESQTYTPPPQPEPLSAAEENAAGGGSETEAAIADSASVQQAPTATATAAASAPPVTTTPPAPPAAKPPAQMDLVFYEIGRESWVTLANEGKPAGEQSGWRALAFANRDRLQATLVNARRLPGQKMINTQASSAAGLHYQIGNAGAAANPIPLGLFIDLSVIKMDGTVLELELVGQVDLRHENNQETHQKSGFVASFNPTGALVIHGIMPRKNIVDPANTPTANTPLSVLVESPDYLEGQSEVVLVIQGR